MQVDIPVTFPLFENENIKAREHENYIRKVATQEDLTRSNALLTKTKQKRGRNKYKGNYGIKS